MTAQTSTSLSISVVCFNSPIDELKTLVESTLIAIQRLKSKLSLAPVALYLVDNSEAEPLSLEAFAGLQVDLDALDVQLKLVHGQGNIGYGAAHNLVIKRIETDYHLLLNPDLSLDKNCLVAGISQLQTNEDIVMASPYVENETGEKQYLCKRYPSVLTFLIRGFFPTFLKNLFKKRLANFEMHDLPEDVSSEDIPIVSGCFMLCRSQALKNLAGFDEKFFLYFEDFDLSLRMGKLGKISYVPTMRIRHAGGNAAGKGWDHIKMFASSGMYFFNKHGWRFFRQSS